MTAKKITGKKKPAPLSKLAWATMKGRTFTSVEFSKERIWLPDKERVVRVRVTEIPK